MVRSQHVIYAIAISRRLDGMAWRMCPYAAAALNRLAAGDRQACGLGGS